jgi:hypothetical protein
VTEVNFFFTFSILSTNEVTEVNFFFTFSILSTNEVNFFFIESDYSRSAVEAERGRSADRKFVGDMRPSTPTECIASGLVVATLSDAAGKFGVWSLYDRLGA